METAPDQNYLPWGERLEPPGPGIKVVHPRSVEGYRLALASQHGVRHDSDKFLTVYSLGHVLSDEPPKAHIAVHLGGNDKIGPSSFEREESELFIGELVRAAGRTVHAVSENASTDEPVYDVLAYCPIFADEKKPLAFLKNLKLLNPSGEIIFADELRTWRMDNPTTWRPSMLPRTVGLGRK